MRSAMAAASSSSTGPSLPGTTGTPAAMAEALARAQRFLGLLTLEEDQPFSGDALMALRSVALDPAAQVTLELVEALAGMRASSSAAV